jgi:hypothetical protein
MTYQSSQHQRIFVQSVDPSDTPRVPSRRYRRRCHCKAKCRRNQQGKLLAIDNIETIVLPHDQSCPTLAHFTTYRAHVKSKVVERGAKLEPGLKRSERSE